MEKNYKIICSTNPWIAERDVHFPKGKTWYVVADKMTLKEAQAKLLALYNDYYELDCPNWGMAVASRRKKADGAYPTKEDGTRSFYYDGRNFEIIEDDDDSMPLTQEEYESFEPFKIK